MTIFFSFILFIVFLVPLMTQPLSLGLLIMFLSLFFSLLIGVFGFSIYGFILFLVFVGGLLVMFGYVLVLIPNMQFSGSYYFFFFFFFLFMFWFNFDFFFFSDNLDYLFSDFFFYLYVGLALALLFCLVVVVKVCYFHSGSLRPFFSYLS